MWGDVRRDDRGFSMVELLMVMVIIALLAAIAIPLYLDHQRKANDAAAQSDAMSLGTMIRSAYDDDGADAVSVTSDGENYLIDGVKALGMSPGVEFVSWSDDGIDDWCLQLRHPHGAVSADPGVRFDSANGYVENAAC